MDQQWLRRFGIQALGAYGRAITEKAGVPVSFILNEVVELEHIEQGVHSGFNVVMLDSCHLPFNENVEITTRVVELARPHGVEVQAELGQLPTFGENIKGALTDPEQARDFVQMTNVDFLAVSIGNVHLQIDGKSAIDINRLKAIRNAVDIPLVIHGGTGFPAEQVRTVIENGVSLFHFGTLMKKAFFEATKTCINSLDKKKVDYQSVVGSRKNTDILQPAKQKIESIVQQYMRIYGCSGKG